MTKKNMILSIVNICLIIVIFITIIITIATPIANNSSTMWMLEDSISKKANVNRSALVLIAYDNDGEYIYFTDYSFLNSAESYNTPKLCYYNSQNETFVEKIVVTANSYPTKEEINSTLNALKIEVGFDDSKVEFVGA